jgi:hypothetical protein
MYPCIFAHPVQVIDMQCSVFEANLSYFSPFRMTSIHP